MTGSVIRDWGRTWMWGIARCSGKTFQQAIRLLKGRIWNLHVEDIPGRKHYHMIPGEGTMNWRGLRLALEGIGYGRTVTVELYTCSEDPDTAARKSLEFLEKVFG